jgi:O-antigen/teichoic acid export membrane protein
VTARPAADRPQSGSTNDEAVTPKAGQPAQPRRWIVLPAGTVAVGGGLLVLGLSAYVFLAVSARAVGPDRFAALSVLWVLVYTAGPGLFLPLEQETGRALAARRARDLGGRAVLVRAATLGAGLLVVLVLAAVATRSFLLRSLFDNNNLLWEGLLLSIVGMGGASLYRGALAGTERFGRYGGQLGIEGGLRLVGCGLLAAASVRSAGPYGLLVGLAPILALLLTLRSPRSLVEPGPPASWSEMSGALSLLLIGSLLSQSLVNAGPVLVKLLAMDSEQQVAGQFLAGLIVARVPLFLFTAVQAALLPGLASLAGAGKHRELRTRLRQTTLLVAAIGVVGSLGAFAVGPEVVHVFFGRAFDLGRLDLLWLAAASAAYMLALVWAQGLIALRGHGLASLSWMIGVAVHLLVTAAVRGLLPRVEFGFLAGTAAAAGVMGALLLRRTTASGPGPSGHAGPGSAAGSVHANR